MHYFGPERLRISVSWSSPVSKQICRSQVMCQYPKDSQNFSVAARFADVKGPLKFSGKFKCFEHQLRGDFGGKGIFK